MNPVIRDLNNNSQMANANNAQPNNVQAGQSPAQIFQMFQNSRNPKELAFQMLGGNSEIMGALKNGSSYKQVAMALLRQQGKSLGDVLKMF